MGILLVFDVTKEDSFKNITDWLRNIEKHTTGTINKLLLGNKCDLEDKRVVSKEQAGHPFACFLFVCLRCF
jgi:GTPase SAR1 family protein